KQVQTGIGETTLDVAAPTLGNKHTVSASVRTVGGLTLSASIVIGSGSVDMIIESDGHAPIFYKGKVSPVHQNTLKITAIPHLANPAGSEYDPKTLVYQWKKNDQVLLDQSGYGAQSVTIEGSLIPRPYDVTVTVSSRDGSAR